MKRFVTIALGACSWPYRHTDRFSRRPQAMGLGPEERLGRRGLQLVRQRFWLKLSHFLDGQNPPFGRARPKAERAETLTFEANGSGVVDEPEPEIATTAESPVREEPISEGPVGAVARGVNDPAAGAGGGADDFRKTNDPIWLPGWFVARGVNDPRASSGGGADCFRKTNDPILLGAAAEVISCPAAQCGESAECPFLGGRPRTLRTKPFFDRPKSTPQSGSPGRSGSTGWESTP